MPALALLPLLLPALLHAAPTPPAGGSTALADLQARLQALAPAAAGSPIRAAFTHHFEASQGEGEEAIRTTGDAAGVVEENAEGVRLTWPRAVLDRARAEERARAANPDAPAPARDAIAAVGATDLAGYLDAASQVLQVLEGATLLEDRTDAVDGAPARLLVLKLQPKAGARERKYVKDVDATARIWLDADGYPRAAEHRVKLSGRVLLVIGFEQEERGSYRFERVGGRLVAVRHEALRRGSGGGDKGERKSLTTLAPSRG